MVLPLQIVKQVIGIDSGVFIPGQEVEVSFEGHRVYTVKENAGTFDPSGSGRWAKRKSGSPPRMAAINSGLFSSRPHASSCKIPPAHLSAFNPYSLAAYYAFVFLVADRNEHERYPK